MAEISGQQLSKLSPVPAWRSLQEALPVRLAPIRTEVQFADFLDLVGQLVEDYETQHHHVPEAEPRAVLRFFMEQHGLKQIDLSEEIGGQSVVSEILTGKREINARLAKALAARFGVSPAVFI